MIGGISSRDREVFQKLKRSEKCYQKRVYNEPYMDISLGCKNGLQWHGLMLLDWCKQGHLSWFQEIPASQGALVGRKNYEELTRSKWSSGVPFVTLTVKRLLARRREMQTSKSVWKKTLLMESLNFELTEYLSESVL